jgi:hypothetical protein
MGIVIDVQDTMNVDAFLYLNKMRRGTYKSMHLSSVAQYHGCAEKMPYAVIVTQPDRLQGAFDCNMHNLALVSQVWVRDTYIDEKETLIDILKCHV